MAQSIFERMTGGAQVLIDSAYGGGQAVDTEGDKFLAGLTVVLNIALTTIGIIFFALLVYAGYLWMMARGREEEVEKAKKIFREAVIGLLIIVLARIITAFVLTQTAQIATFS